METEQHVQPIPAPEAPRDPEPHERVLNPMIGKPQVAHHLKAFLMGIAAVFIVTLIGVGGYLLGQMQRPATPLVIKPVPSPVPTILIIQSPVATTTAAMLSPTPVETTTTSTLGDILPTKSGKLLLTTNKTSYKKGTDTIYITISNGLGQPIYAQDEATACSIVSVEYLEDTEWKRIEDCFLGRLPANVATGNGRGRVIGINTKPLPPLPANDPKYFKPGLYRIALTYSLSVNGPEFGAELIRPLTLYSPPFTIEQ